MVGVGDHRAEPGRTVLIDGTRPEYAAGKGASGQTIEPCDLVYKSGTAPDNEVTVCSSQYGSSMEDESTIYIVEIPRSHPSFAKSWEKNTAFTALTDGFRMHRIRNGDRMWLRCSSLSVDENDNVQCTSDGEVIQFTGTTADKWNVHTWRVIGVWAGADFIQGEYIGQLSSDTS